MKAPAERVLKDIRGQTRRHFSAEDKIRIVLDGLRGEDSHRRQRGKDVLRIFVMPLSILRP